MRSDAKGKQATRDSQDLAEIASLAWRAARKLGRGTAVIGYADIAQEALLVVVRRYLEKFRNGSPEETRVWIRRIVRCKAKNLLRDQCRVKRDQSRNLSIEAAELEERVPDRRMSPEEAAARAERLARMWAALDRLPKLQRVAIRLHHFRGQSQKAIAARLKIRKQSVRAAIERGLARLRRLLSE